MTNPKIKVGAELDTASIDAGLAKIKATTAELNKSLSGGNGVVFNTKEAEAQLTGLLKDVEAVHAAVEKAGGANVDGLVGALDEASKAASAVEEVLDAVGKSTGMGGAVKNAKDLTEGLVRARRAQDAFNREGIKGAKDQGAALKQNFDTLKSSGMRGASHLKGMEVDDWATGGWKNYSLSDTENKRMRRNVAKRIGLDLPEEKEGSALGRFAKKNAGRLTSGAVGAAVGSASGGGFGIGTMVGGAAGMVPFVGPVLGPILGAIGGAIDKGLERALGEATDLTDLRHSLGAVSVDFDGLRDNVRHFADGLGVTYNEAAKLAKQFAHTANSADNVGGQTGNAVGFGRGFGLDPQAAVQFFATMRHFGSTQNDGDTRKLSLSIAEAIQKGGVSPKADEALAAIQNFVQTSARSSLTEANTEAYASFMSSLTGLSSPGLKGDPQSAASLMGKADAALHQGGNFGEASKNFSLGLYQKMLPGFTALDMGYVNDQGAFGSIDRAFGRDSNAYQMAESMGDRGMMSKYDQWSKKGGDRPILGLQLDALKERYGGSARAMTMAMGTHLGFNPDEASAVYRGYTQDNGLGGLRKKLAGVPGGVDNLNPKQIASLAEIAYGSNSAVKGQATKLKDSKELTGPETKQLADAIAASDKNPEELRKVVLNLSAVHDVTKDEGEKLRDIQSDIANSVQRLATQLIPLTVKINEGLMALVEHFAPESAAASSYTAAAKKRDELDETLDGLKNRIDNHEAIKTQLQANVTSDQNHLAAAEKIKDRRGISEWTQKLAADKAKLAPYLNPGDKQDLMRRYNNALTHRQQLDGDVGPYAHGAYDTTSGKQLPPPPPSSGNGGSRAGRSGFVGRGAGNRLSSAQAQYRDKIVAEARKRGASDDEVAGMLALVEHESHFKPHINGAVIKKGAHKGDRAHGLFQYMGGTAAGRFNRFNPDEQIQHGVADYLKLYRTKGGRRGAAAAWISGGGNVTSSGRIKHDRHDGNQSTSEYVADIDRLAPAYQQHLAQGPKVPAAHLADARHPRVVKPGEDPRLRARELAGGHVTHEVRVVVVDQHGRKMGNASATTQTRAGTPQPAGTVLR
jgi:hypothetical protein